MLQFFLISITKLIILCSLVWEIYIFSLILFTNRYAYSVFPLSIHNYKLGVLKETPTIQIIKMIFFFATIYLYCHFFKDSTKQFGSMVTEWEPPLWIESYQYTYVLTTSGRVSHKIGKEAKVSMDLYFRDLVFMKSFLILYAGILPCLESNANERC